MQIIAHKENVIYDVRYLHRLNLVEIPGAGGIGNGERISLAIPAALPVQLGAKLPEQQREVLLVRRPMDGPGRTTETGYSQSRSTPSRPYSAAKAAQLAAKVSRRALVDATSEKYLESDHPPTEISSLS